MYTDQSRFVIDYFRSTPVDHKFYVEIGAFNGVDISNTSALDVDGWSGICIEPNRRHYYSLLQNRPRALCLPYAVGGENGEMEFLEVVGYSEMLSGLLSEYDPRHLERLRREVAERQQDTVVYNVPVRTLSHIMDLVNRQRILYASIDVEGAEQSILNGIDWKRHRFELISLEDNFNENVGADTLVANGYENICRIGADNFWGRK